jgi:hypothetical protein
MKKKLLIFSPGDAISESIKKKRFDIGLAGMYVTTERNTGMEMSASHSMDCASFVSWFFIFIFSQKNIC